MLQAVWSVIFEHVSDSHFVAFVLYKHGYLIQVAESLKEPQLDYENDEHVEPDNTQ